MENNLQLLQDFKALNVSALATLSYATRELDSLHNCIIEAYLKYERGIFNHDEYTSAVNFVLTQANEVYQMIKNNIICGLYNYVNSYMYERYKRDIYNIYEEIKTEYYNSLEV